MMLIDNQCLAAKVFYYNQTERNLTEEGTEKKGEKKLLRCTKKKRLPAAILKLGRSPMIDRMTVPKPISPSYF